MAYDDKKVLGLIPARGGSKGLHRKNIAPLNGKPLIAYSINAGLQSTFIDTAIVSSEDSEILDVARKYGADVLQRPMHLATDSASINQVIAQAVDSVDKNIVKYEFIVLLQPTSPLRSAKHIDAAFNQLKKTEARSLISVYTPEKSPYKCFVCDDDGYLKGLVSNDAPFMNRQELKEVYMPNGAIYIFRRVDFLKSNRIPVERTVPFLMSIEESIDIDRQADLETAEKYLKKLERE